MNAIKGRRVTIAAIGLGLLLAGACGGGDDGGSSAGDATTTALTIEANEFEFSPSGWTVAADTDVTITLDNKGAVIHEWVLLSSGNTISSEADFDEGLVAHKISDVEAGTTGTVTFNLPAGEYQVICKLEGHLDAGMEGTLTVGGA